MRACVYRGARARLLVLLFLVVVSQERGTDSKPPVALSAYVEYLHVGRFHTQTYTLVSLYHLPRNRQRLLASWRRPAFGVEKELPLVTFFFSFCDLLVF